MNYGKFLIVAALGPLAVLGQELGFGPGHASSFYVGRNEKAFVVGVSGLTWSDFALRDYRGQGYQDADKKGQRFHCFTDARVMDVEKKSDRGTDYNWCGLYSRMQALLWCGYIQGYANEDAVADVLRQSGGDAAAEGALNGLVSGAPAFRVLNSWIPTESNPAALLDGLVTLCNGCDVRFVMDVFIDHVSGDRENAYHTVSLVGYSLDTTKPLTDPGALKGLFVIDSDNDMYDGQGGSSAPDTITYCPISYESYGSSDFDYPTRQYFKISNVFGTWGIVDQVIGLQSRASVTVVKTESAEIPGETQQEPEPQSAGPEVIEPGQILVQSGADRYLTVTGPAIVTYDWQAFGDAAGGLTAYYSGIEWRHIVMGSEGRRSQSVSFGEGSRTIHWTYYGSGYGIVENVKVVTEGIVAAASIDKATTLYGCVRAGTKVVGSVEIKLGRDSRGKGSKVSGSLTLFGGKKKTLKAKDAAQLSKGPVNVTLAVAREGNAAVMIGKTAKGTLAFSGSYGGYTLESAVVGGEHSKSAFFGFVDQFPASIDGGAVNPNYLPNGEPVTMAGKKWKLAAAATVKYAKDRSTGNYGWVVNNGKPNAKKTNLSGLKLTYTSKTGLFKGSFKAYTLVGTKMKKVSVAVNGLVVEGIGYGMATVKKGGSYAVVIDVARPSSGTGGASDADIFQAGPNDVIVSSAGELRTAIENAAGGETIYLRNGTYFIDKSLQVRKSINVVGESADGVKIVGAKDDFLAGLYFGRVSASAAINVNVSNCSFSHMDVCYGATVVFQNCRQTSSAVDIGLHCFAMEEDAPAVARAANCTFRSATCSMGPNASIVLDGCTIDQTGSNYWGLYASEGSITANSSAVIGGGNGVFAFSGSVVTVSNSVIRNAGCAVSSFSNSSVTLNGCTIEGCAQEQHTYEGGKITIN